jgi:hypothetical protein
VTIIKVYREGAHVDGAFTLENALKRARVVAGGRRAKAVRRGDKLGFSGPLGFVYVDEADAKLVDEQNRANSGGRLKGAP